MLFQIQIIADAFVSGICHNVTVASALHPLDVIQKRNERTGIGAVGKSSDTGNIFTVDRKLDIVGRFQLAIPHVVFFHPHECSVLVGFGHTSAVIANGEQLVLVLCPLRPQAVQLFIPLLPFALAFSDPVNKFCIWRKLLICQLSQLLPSQIAFSTVLVENFLYWKGQLLIYAALSCILFLL